MAIKKFSMSKFGKANFLPKRDLGANQHATCTPGGIEVTRCTSTRLHNVQFSPTNLDNMQCVSTRMQVSDADAVVASRLGSTCAGFNLRMMHDLEVGL